MTYFVTSVLIISTFLWNVSLTLRMFHLGRARGGNLGKPHIDIETAPVPDLWFDQILDHFDSSDVRSWKQRYFVNDSFWQPNGPVFLMIGGEGPANPLWVQTGAWIDYAKEHNALCLLLEHRYYGKSHPTSDLSVKNLKWLSSEQALADLATFIVAMNELYSLPPQSRWVAFGGSYPGSLAAWLRAKYPHLVYASVSSSGPLLAKVDFKEYLEVVWNALSEANPDCVSTLVASTSQIQNMAQTKKGRASLEQLFRLCTPLNITNGYDISSLFDTLAGNVAGIVQYSGDNREFEGAKGVNIAIPAACDVLTDSSIGSPVHRFAQLSQMILDAYNLSCLDYAYISTVEQLRETSWSSAVSEGGRQWMWQTCTEFGFYQTSSGKPELFGNDFPVDFFIKQCSDIYGSRYDKSFVQRAVDISNTEYGGLAIDTSRVIFIHGSVDPWHALGITQTLLPSCPAIYIKGTAHCANMYPPRDSDLPELKLARKQIRKYLSLWLKHN